MNEPTSAPTPAPNPIDDLIAAAEDMLRGGEHEEDCTNDDISRQGEPCWRHLQACADREAKLKVAVEQARQYQKLMVVVKGMPCH